MEIILGVTEAGLSWANILRIVGLIVIPVALILLVFIEFIHRRRIGTRAYHWLLLIGILVIPGIAMLSTTSTLFEETKTVESCYSCHNMHPFVDDMKDSSSSTLAARHYKNKWIPEHQCYTCHTDYGFHGTLEAKRDGFRHWFKYVTNSWDGPIRFKGSYNNSNCTECHTGTKKFEAVKTHQALKQDLLTSKIGCFSCHGPVHPTAAERKK